MPARFTILLALAAVFVQGCSSLLIKSSPAPVLYQLEYEPTAIACNKSFDKGLRVWNFGASSPYDQVNMVVLDKGRKVNFSSAYQWVSLPGTLVANSLLRDFSAGALFTQAVDSNSPLTPPLELAGHVFTFAWENTDSGYRARLHVEISLVDAAGKRSVILRKNYRLTSKPYAEDSSDAFARAMSSLVRDLSERLQEDLCKKA